MALSANAWPYGARHVRARAIICAHAVMKTVRHAKRRTVT